jgi:hypothetical protein
VTTSDFGYLQTGRGRVYPSGRGDAIFQVVSPENPAKTKHLVLKEALFVPSMDISIFSSLQHYNARGYLSRKTLYKANQQPIIHLDPSKTGFFIPQKGVQAPQAYST